MSPLGHYPSSYRVMNGVCFSFEADCREKVVIELSGHPVLPPCTLLYVVEGHLMLNVERIADNGGIVVTPVYTNPLTRWQKIACALFGLKDRRMYPPCIKIGSTVIELGESFVEGESGSLTYHIPKESQ